MKLLKLIICLVLAFGVIFLAVNYVERIPPDNVPTPTPTVTPMLSPIPTSTPTLTVPPTLSPTPTPNELSIITQPTARSIYLNDYVTLKCVGSSSIGREIKYQWNLNTINSIIDSSIIGGSTSATYTFSPTRSYYLYCVVSSVGANSIVSNIIKITVLATPTPTATPIKCSTCSGVGTIKCTSCNGLGSNGSSQGGYGCTNCGGSGNTLDGSFIAGSGRVDCPSC